MKTFVRGFTLIVVGLALLFLTLATVPIGMLRIPGDVISGALTGCGIAELAFGVIFALKRKPKE